jgi:DNA-binding response OmpR family regulator/anti-sigma regulatory factor (Ser/Thr protein kinase)
MTLSATILLVEDDRALLEGIADLLEVSAIGYDLQVLKATDGQMGLQVLASQMPDLIISDIMMPRMGGFEFLEQVRQAPEWVHIPVIFLTAKGTKHDVLRGRMSGAELYIKKPYDGDELVQLVKSQLDRALELRADRQRKVSTLSRNIVQLLHHEFRTPLTYVSAYYELLAAGLGQEDDESLREYLGGIQIGAQRMSTMVGNLLQVLAIWTSEAGQTYKSSASMIHDVGAVLNAQCEYFRDEMTRANGIFHCDIQRELPSFFGQRDFIGQIVHHLLLNAVSFSQKIPGRQPEVSFRASADADHLLLTIEDNGVGIPESARDHIFELFYQHDRERLEQQGAGAGLTIAQGLAELHGGRIESESEPGVGSTFTVTLPLLSADAVGATTDSLMVANPATILLVEDEEFLLEGLKDLLETYDNRYRLTILTATDGREALSVLAEHTPDLIVTDIMMPRMNGYQFLTEVRANPDWVDIPVIFLTAKGERQDVVLGLRSGAEEYITKPYDADELFGVVSAQLDRHFLRQGATKESLEQLKVSVLELLLSEFQMPLDDVKQYADRLTDGLARVHSFEQLQTYLRGLEDGSSHVARLVEDFVLLVELRTGEAIDWFRLQAKPTAINSILQPIGIRLQDVYDWLEVEIRYNLERGSDEVLVDRQLLDKCLERLAEVIFTYCPNEQPVKLVLASATDSDRILIQVGSPDARLDGETVTWLNDLLENQDPFVPELSEYSLTLLLVKGIVQYHEGELSVWIGPGHGLTFIVSLPEFYQESY